MLCIKLLHMTLDKIAQLILLFIYFSIIHPTDQLLRKMCNIPDI